VGTEQSIDAGVKRAAHRPSRRREIIDAATVVFAREGYAEANVETSRWRRGWPLLRSITTLAARRSCSGKRCARR
jgi:hypothetical protein